jgi:hypothetical protein
MIQTLTWRYGVSAGIITLIYFIIFYTIDKCLIFNSGVYYSALIITIVAMWLVGIRLQLSQNLDFSKLLPQVFLVFIIADIIYFAWHYVMVNYVDTSLLDLQKTQMLQYFQQLKTQTNDIKEIQGWNEAIQSLEKNGLPSVSLSNILLQLGRGIIGGFVLSYGISFALNRGREKSTT